MTIAMNSLMMVLLIWFWGCVVGYKTSKWVLVDGTGLKGIEFKWWLIYLGSCLAFLKFQAIGQWILTAFLLIWFIIQFICHWYFTIFGSSENKLKGYNKCFKGTIHIVPISDRRLIPDLYHTIIHILIFVLLILCIVKLIAGI